MDMALLLSENIDMRFGPQMSNIAGSNEMTLVQLLNDFRHIFFS
jgi:hypothetical protein